MLDIGVSPDCIIYANPCKQISHLKYASQNAVDVMTFDNEFELYKVQKYFPSAKWAKTLIFSFKSVIL